MDTHGPKPDRSHIDPEVYRIAFEHGTERAFTGRYWDCHDDGVYRCAVCDAALFDSKTKYDSGSGWPSYTAPVAADAVSLHEDRSHGMRRVECRCRGCGAHLGHVFEDGPSSGEGATGQRWCINSAVLRLTGRGCDGGTM
jgi:peptide-methionine (R)-S-oxide reductase